MPVRRVEAFSDHAEARQDLFNRYAPTFEILHAGVVVLLALATRSTKLLSGIHRVRRAQRLPSSRPIERAAA